MRVCVPAYLHIVVAVAPCAVLKHSHGPRPGPLRRRPLRLVRRRPPTHRGAGWPHARRRPAGHTDARLQLLLFSSRLARFARAEGGHFVPWWSPSHPPPLDARRSELHPAYLQVIRHSLHMVYCITCLYTVSFYVGAWRQRRSPPPRSPLPSPPSSALPLPTHCARVATFGGAFRADCGRAKRAALAAAALSSGGAAADGDADLASCWRMSSSVCGGGTNRLRDKW